VNVVGFQVQIAPSGLPLEKIDGPRTPEKEETMNNSAKFIKTKRRLLELFRPTGRPAPETPARTTPDEIQSDEDAHRFDSNNTHQ